MNKGLFTWTQDSKIPRGNHCQGQVLPRERMMTRGNNFIAWDKLIIIWIRLAFPQIVTENEF